MYDKDFCEDMLDFTKFMFENFSKDEAVKVLDNLKLWVDTGCDTYSYMLKKIALGYKGERTPMSVDYNKEVKKNLVEYYSHAAEKGSYATELLEAGLAGKRGHDILSYLSCYEDKHRSEFDIIKYVSDGSWSDYWIRQIGDNTRHLKEHADFGYDLMSIFTPKHDTSTFFDICLYLKDEERYRIPLDWLKDEHWRHNEAVTVMRLYFYVPGFNWGVDIVQPWMSGFAIDEIYENKNQAALNCNAIIEKWKNVSPKLEYALRDYCEHDGIGRDKIYEQYEAFRKARYCDGDELAAWLYRGTFPDDVIAHNAYYHECVNGWHGVSVETSTPKGGKPGASSSPFNAAAIMGGD